MKQFKNINWKQTIKNYKQWIPNVLTSIRILFTPLIIILGIQKRISFVILLAILTAFTDFLDGNLARKWNTVSETGAKLDAVADKVFAIGLCLSLASIFPILWTVIVLECILAICNLFFHYKSKKTESLWIGKVKTTLLFITIIGVIGYHFIPKLEIVIQGLIYVALNLQILCIIEYSFNFYDNMHPITVEDNLMHQSIMNDTDEEEDKIDKTIELEHLGQLMEQYESEKSNIE